MEEARRVERVPSARVVGLHQGVDAGTPALVALARHPWRKADVARELGVSERTVGRYMRQGLPFCKPFGPGGLVCFAPLAVRRWLAGSRQMR